MTRQTDAATAALIAEALARKGATKVAVGTSSGITDRQWYKASQGVIDLRERDLSAERADEQMRERFAEARSVGVPSDVAYLFATGQIECCSCADIVSPEARAHAKAEAARILKGRR